MRKPTSVFFTTDEHLMMARIVEVEAELGRADRKRHGVQRLQPWVAQHGEPDETQHEQCGGGDSDQQHGKAGLLLQRSRSRDQRLQPRIVVPGVAGVGPCPWMYHRASRLSYASRTR